MVTQTLNQQARRNRVEALLARHACPEGRTSTSRPSNWMIARIMLVLTLSFMPLMAISAHVFGLVSERTSALVAVVPLTAVLGIIITFSPHRIDAIVGQGLIAGMVACLIYDGARLFAVHGLHLMGDFIPRMGTWVIGGSDATGGAAVGYVWRYLGDGGGLGVAFFVIAFAVGLDRLSDRPHRVVLAAVGFGVFVWTGLIGTVALAPHGQELLFRLTPAAIVVTLIGHLIFGFVLGLAFLRSLHGREGQWPWPPLTVSLTFAKPQLAFAR
jgi:hypothetical protein